MKNGDFEEILELVHSLESRQRRRVIATFIGLILAVVVAGAIARLSFFEAKKSLARVGNLSEAREDGRRELERMETAILQMKAETARIQEELARVRKEKLQAEAEAERVSRGGAQAQPQSPSDGTQVVEMRENITRLEQELATTRQQLKEARQNVEATQPVEMQQQIKRLQQELETTRQQLTHQAQKATSTQSGKPQEDVNRLQQDLADTQEQLKQERQNVAVLSEEAERYRTDALELQRQMDEGAYHSVLNQALAYTYRKAVGDPKQADTAYRKALQIAESKNIRDPTIYNAYATFLQDQNRFEEAERFYKMALEVDASYGKALNNLGTLYEATGRLKQALEKYRAAGENSSEWRRPSYR